MVHNEKRGNYRFQFKVFGIGLIIAIAVAACLIVLGKIKWFVGVGLVLAVLFFEIMYFLILRDTVPSPLTQNNMRKGIEFIDEEGNMVKEVKPGVYKVDKQQKE